MKIKPKQVWQAKHSDSKAYVIEFDTENQIFVSVYHSDTIVKQWWECSFYGGDDQWMGLQLFMMEYELIK